MQPTTDSAISAFAKGFGPDSGVNITALVSVLMPMDDLRYAVRAALRSPMGALVIIASLALGIGANTAVFSFVDAVQFKPLPFQDEYRLVDVHEWSATDLCSGCAVGTSYPLIPEIRAAVRRRSRSGGRGRQDYSGGVTGLGVSGEIRRDPHDGPGVRLRWRSHRSGPTG